MGFFDSLSSRARNSYADNLDRMASETDDSVKRAYLRSEAGVARLSALEYDDDDDDDYDY